GRVRSYLLAGQERTADLKNGGARYLRCVSCASTLEAPGDGSEGDGERRGDGAEGLGFIFQGAQFDRRGILFVEMLDDLAYGGKHELRRTLRDPSSQDNQIGIEDGDNICNTDAQHGEDSLQN